MRMVMVMADRLRCATEKQAVTVAHPSTACYARRRYFAVQRHMLLLAHQPAHRSARTVSPITGHMSAPVQAAKNSMGPQTTCA